MNIEILKAHLSEPRGKAFLVLDDMNFPTKVVNNQKIVAKSRAMNAGETELSVAKKIIDEADWFAFYSTSELPAHIVLRFASGTFSEIGL